MPEYRGLINEGSTCYLNSLLQTLFMTPEFRQHVYNYVHDQRKIAAADSIPYQLQKLFVLLQLNQKPVYTKGLLKSFQWNEVDSFQQHDVQQFCRVLFQALSLASKGANWIEKMYSGLMESFISCGKHPRSNQQVFMDISLPIKDLQTQKCYQSIEECLKAYLKPENIEDKINCEGCGEKVKVEKGLKLTTLPTLLTLQINRFQLNYNTMQREKINSFLYFPEILELGRFMVPYAEIKIKDLPKDLLQKVMLIQKQKSARQTDWGIGGGGLSIQGKKIERKKSFEVEAEKKQTKFYDQQNRDKRQDQTKKLSAEQQKIKNMQILKDLKAQKQKLDRKKTEQKKPTQTAQSKLDDDMLFGSFMEGFDISGKSELNQYQDIMISNETKKGSSVPKFQKTQAVFLHDEEKFDVNKEYEKNTYVLFSILVHSGGAYGGHYYAYIFNGQDWFCFNDNTVTKATREQIRKYGHPTESSSYGANAYLLFYREANAFKEVAKEGEIKIPEQLLEKVRADKTILNQPIKVANEMMNHSRYTQIQNSVILKIKHKGQVETLVIPDRRTETVKYLRNIVKANLNIVEQDKNWRLRRYNKSQDSMHQVYDIEENFDKSLEQVGLRQTCHLAIETKTEEQQFLDYDPKNITIKLNVWREGLTLLTETFLKPVKIAIREQKTFNEFYQQVERALNITNPVIIKRNFSVGNPFQLFEPSAYGQKTLLSLRFFNGINLYIEEPSNEPKLKWQKQFEDQKYKCQIKFNNPKEGQQKNQQLFIDTRKTLGELKQKISLAIGMSIEQFRIKKSQQAVSEMTTYKKRLVDLKFVNVQYLHIEEGKSSKGTVLIRKGFVSLIDDQIQFNLGDQFQVDIDNSTSTVADLKTKIAQKYGLIQFNIRVREFKAHQFGQIFRDSENLLKIKQKSLVWEQLQIEDAKGLQLYLRVFNVMTLELGPLLSIFVEASGNYEELTLIVEEQTQIQSDKLLVHKPATNFVDKSLLFECEWIESKFIPRPIREEPLFLTYDGEILIVKEAQTPYHPKPIQKYQVYESERSTQKGYKKQAGLKITVIQEKETDPIEQKPENTKTQTTIDKEDANKKQSQENQKSQQKSK